MEFHRFLYLFLVFFACFLSSSQAYKFHVGGKDGWVLQPSENYNHWAERNRFLVNDTLFFKYKKGSDSVLVVSKDDYNKCNKDKPIMKMEDGDSVFKFDKSGTFFFISGNNGSCEKGQKLIVLVLAVKHHKSPVPAMSPKSPVPAMSPKSPAPAMPPTSPSPMGASPTPAMTPTSTAPVMSPAPSTSPMSPSPMTQTPVSSPTPASSPMSPSTPAVFPAPEIAPISPSAMTEQPISSPPGETSAPSTGISLPPGTNPGGVIMKEPAPAPSPASVVTPASIFVAAVTILLSVVIGSFINAL